MTNEAAEWLGKWILEADADSLATIGVETLDSALTTERRATVERIRAWFTSPLSPSYAIYDEYIARFLDAEAAR